MRINLLSALADTNFLLRLAEPSHPMFQAVMRAIAVLGLQGCVVSICPQNIVEFWAVATRPTTANGLGMTPAQADAELARIETLFPLLPDTPAVLPVWRRLVTGAGVSGKVVHDARLLAFAQVYGVGRLLTFNTMDFARYAALAPAVQVTDPQTV